MSRSGFTRFAQQYFDALLNGFGTVYPNEPVPRNPKLRVYKLPSRSNSSTELLGALTAETPHIQISPEITAEAKLVDVLFEPDAEIPSVVLGLLGELLVAPCIIETLRSLPTAEEVRTCLGHWLRWQVEADGGMIEVDQTPVSNEDEHEADIEDEDELVDKTLLILVPTITEKQLEGWGTTPSSRNVPGLYEFPPAYCTTIVVIGELPQTLTTLWLRLLGRGATQRSAITELIALEPSHPLRAIALRQLQQWHEQMIQGQMPKESPRLMQLLSQIQI